MSSSYDLARRRLAISMPTPITAASPKIPATVKVPATAPVLEKKLDDDGPDPEAELLGAVVETVTVTPAESPEPLDPEYVGCCVTTGSRLVDVEVGDVADWAVVVDEDVVVEVADDVAA